MEQIVYVDGVCKTWFSQMRGLMFSSKKVLLFVFSMSQQVSLHNWFVFFPIDLVFLNDDNVVVEVKKRFMPFSLYKSNLAVTKLIESPNDIACSVGDKIKIKKRR